MGRVATIEAAPMASVSNELRRSGGSKGSGTALATLGLMQAFRERGPSRQEVTAARGGARTRVAPQASAGLGRFARALARVGVLIAAGVGSLGFVHASYPSDEDACAPPRILCHHLCVDPRTSPRHCGSCDNRCQSQACTEGRCVVDGDDPTP